MLRAIARSAIAGCSRIDFARLPTMLPAIAMSAIACGRVDFEKRATSDAPSDGEPPSAALQCVPGEPFGAPRLVDELSSDGLDGTFRLLDDNSGYFWSATGGHNDIFFAHRPDAETPFEIEETTGLNTGANEVDPTVTSDGALMLFRRSSGGDDIYLSRRLGGPTSWSTPAIATPLSGTSSDTQPFLQPGGNELYFCSYRTGQGDLYRSIRAGDTFSNPARVAEVSNATSAEGDPVISSDGLTLYFRSNRDGSGAFDIYVATRGDVSAQFQTPVLLPNVNSAGDDGPSALSSDDCHLYLSSDRAGTNDIYIATRGVP